MVKPLVNNWCNLNWSEWIPLDSDIKEFKQSVSSEPGFYRIRATNQDGLFYIGQTGRNLRERTRQLSIHTFRKVTPWNDPHTAAPTLWAYRNEEGFDFQVSVAVSHFQDAERQCFEDYLIYCHRKYFDFSPTANFGVCHPLWNKPSNKKAGRIMEKNKVKSATSSLGAPTNTNQFDSLKWLGLNWSEALPFSEFKPSRESGVYKITDGKKLLYCGEAKNIQARTNNYNKHSLLKNVQISCAEMIGAEPNHLKERETDMIGAYYESFSEAPFYQYTGLLHK